MVAAQAVAVKIYVAAVEALMKKERQGETQGILMVLWFHPLLNANALICRFFFESHPVYDQTQGTGAVFS